MRHAIRNNQNKQYSNVNRKHHQKQVQHSAYINKNQGIYNNTTTVRLGMHGNRNNIPKQNQSIFKTAAASCSTTVAAQTADIYLSVSLVPWYPFCRVLSAFVHPGFPTTFTPSIFPSVPPATDARRFLLEFASSSYHDRHLHHGMRSLTKSYPSINTEGNKTKAEKRNQSPTKTRRWCSSDAVASPRGYATENTADEPNTKKNSKNYKQLRNRLAALPRHTGHRV